MRQYLISNHNKQSGFTLIELLVAIALLAVISVISYSALSSAANSQSAFLRVSKQRQEITLASTVIRDDLINLASRPVRDSDGNQIPALEAKKSASFLLSFSRGGVPNIINDESGLERIEYQLIDNKLYRNSLGTLARNFDNKENKVMLLSKVKDIKFTFFSQPEKEQKKLTTSNVWPPSKQSAKVPRAALLPYAIELQITMLNGQEIQLLIPGVQFPKLYPALQKEQKEAWGIN